eukprot:501834-Prymnesium_polylepis.1
MADTNADAVLMEPGHGICKHGRQHHFCKPCGGKGFCEHGRRRILCKDCGGSGICAHNRERSKCKDCGGKSFCEHGKLRRFCKDCGGKGLCEHGRQRYQCKECGGKGICAHGRRRHQCKGCRQRVGTDKATTVIESEIMTQVSGSLGPTIQGKRSSLTTDNAQNHKRGGGVASPGGDAVQAVLGSAQPIVAKLAVLNGAVRVELTVRRH